MFYIKYLYSIGTILLLPLLFIIVVALVVVVPTAPAVLVPHPFMRLPNAVAAMPPPVVSAERKEPSWKVRRVGFTRSRTAASSPSLFSLHCSAELVVVIIGTVVVTVVVLGAVVIAVSPILLL